MKASIILLSMALSGYGANTLAEEAHNHGSHDHSHHHHKPAVEVDRAPIDSVTAAALSSDIIADLVKSKAIDGSWAELKPSSTIAVSDSNADGSQDKFWYSTFHNPKISEGDKQFLYVTFTNKGQYIGTNYIGR